MWIKICGVRDVATAEAIAACGPDAIGLNFHPPSPRCISVERAAEIVQAVRRRSEAIEPVAVFVDRPATEIDAICRACEIRTVQLHGDETPNEMNSLKQTNGSLRIIRAWRLGEEGFGPLDAHLVACRRAGIEPAACLIDARVEGLHGGTGRQAPWELITGDAHRDERPPLILAGGLRPDNIAAAIRTVRPWGVDTASGVESAPGVKDLALVERFIDAARSASSDEKNTD